jgi:hypothetical protein
MKWDLTPGQTKRRSLAARVLGFVCVFLPFGILITTMLRAGQTPQPVLAGGVAASAFLALGLILHVGFARICTHRACSPLYLIAALVMWMTSHDTSGWFIQVAMGTLLGVPVLLFTFQAFHHSRSSLRRARALVRRLASKTDWPDTLVECKTLPEVKALREALRDDAEPAMVLLMHSKPEVRIAALAALEFRPAWNKGQIENVLKAAMFATEPPVRAAALMALANVDDADVIANIAVYFRDATQEVRAAAAEALLWDAERRWSLIRTELRSAMSDYRCGNDGPLPCTGPLPLQAVTDLTVWSGEAGILGMRATFTLRQHFRRELSENPTPELMEEIALRIRNDNEPSALRLELAYLLSEVDFASPQIWQPLLVTGQPSALRLLAAGALLQSDSHETALETLREVARIPNREMALQVAFIVQKSLRVDMGLPLGGPIPEPKSKQAAEIARRVINWADGRALDDEPPTPRRTRVSSLARQISRPSGELPSPRV